jgi:uncharacterized membrane protein
MTRLIAGLSVLGTGIAAYLVWVHFAGLEPVCVGGGACERVQSSPYAELAGVPVAVIGLGGYAAILTSLALPGPAGRQVTAFLALAGAGFSAYLTYLEVGVIDAICQWCVASAIVMSAVAVAAVARLVLSELDGAALYDPALRQTLDERTPVGGETRQQCHTSRSC